MGASLAVIVNGLRTLDFVRGASHKEVAHEQSACLTLLGLWCSHLCRVARVAIVWGQSGANKHSPVL